MTPIDATVPRRIALAIALLIALSGAAPSVWAAAPAKAVVEREVPEREARSGQRGGSVIRVEARETPAERVAREMNPGAASPSEPLVVRGTREPPRIGLVELGPKLKLVPPRFTIGRSSGADASISALRPDTTALQRALRELLPDAGGVTWYTPAEAAVSADFPSGFPLDTFDPHGKIAVFVAPRALQVLRLYDGVNSKELGRWVSCCPQPRSPLDAPADGPRTHADLRGLALPPGNTQDYLALQTIPAGTRLIVGIAKAWTYSTSTSHAAPGAESTSDIEVAGGGLQIYLGNVVVTDSQRFKRRADAAGTPTPARDAAPAREPIEVEINVLDPDHHETHQRTIYDPISLRFLREWLAPAA